MLRPLPGIVLQQKPGTLSVSKTGLSKTELKTEERETEIGLPLKLNWDNILEEFSLNKQSLILKK